MPDRRDTPDKLVTILIVAALALLAYTGISTTASNVYLTDKARKVEKRVKELKEKMSREEKPGQDKVNNIKEYHGR